MDTPKPCPDCGSEIPPDAPGGWCPRCTFQQLAQDEADEHQGALSLHDIPQPGATVSYIGDYELLEIIAHGGMGVVYKARQKSLNRIVALKLLLGGVHASEDFKRRFRREAELAAKLQHPNIVPIYEVGEHEGQLYFSMEYVRGRDFAKLAHRRPLSPENAARYLKIVAETVQFAHNHGVLHRDLKPANILLGADDRPRITDFGLACHAREDSSLTASGTTLGTPAFLPPEQASVKRDKVGTWSDVYSLGAVMYYLLTGREPFSGETLLDTLQQVLIAEPKLPREIRPLIPEDLQTICLKCLCKDPRERYPTAGELANDLDRFLKREPVIARPPGWTKRLTMWCNRQPLAASLSALLAIVVLVFSLASINQWRTTQRARYAAQQFEAPQRIANEAATDQQLKFQELELASERERAKTLAAELARVRQNVQSISNAGLKGALKDASPSMPSPPPHTKSPPSQTPSPKLITARWPTVEVVNQKPESKGIPENKPLQSVSPLPAISSQEFQLIAKLDSPTEKVVLDAMAQLEKDYPASTAYLPKLKALLTDNRLMIRRKAARVLGSLHASVGDDDLRNICALLANEDKDARVDGLKSLRGLKSQSVILAITPLLNDTNVNVVRDACRTLAVIGDQSVVPFIEPLLQSPDAKIQKDAQEAINALNNRLH